MLMSVCTDAAAHDMSQGGSFKFQASQPSRTEDQTRDKWLHQAQSGNAIAT